MKKKLALNVFYTLGIVFSGMGMYWSYNNEKYLLLALFGVGVALFIYLKINLLKAFRKEAKK